jgi:uncharacterized repeat protein (TIGR03803 family)
LSRVERREKRTPTGSAGDLQPIKPMKTKNQAMKTHLRDLFLLAALIAGSSMIPADGAIAQTFTTLYSFTGYTNSDGATPYAGLILSGSTLYGAAALGGSSDAGMVFAVNTDGSSFTNLHSFSVYFNETNQYYTNSGAFPHVALVLSGDTLYGTTSAGGNGMIGFDPGSGTVFKVKTNGTGFTALHAFAVLSGPSRNNSDGANPAAGLVLSANTLYGTTSSGGDSGNGTVFALNTDGTGFTNLHRFNSSDGGYPEAGLTLSGNTLYGTTSGGGNSGNGTVFAINLEGTGFTNLHSFEYNSDGAYPGAGLILSGNTLYGTAKEGGSGNQGTVFKVNTDGTGFTNLHSFTPLSVPDTGTNSDGARPTAGLVLSGNTLYGTALEGGSSGVGTVFAVNTDGTGFTTLHHFTVGRGGGLPNARLLLSGNTLYGTTSDLYNGYGTVFSLSFRPQLTIVSSGPNVLLSWPTNVAGFDYTGYTLQSAPAFTGTFTNLPAATSPYTNPIAGPQQFYRLISN